MIPPFLFEKSSGDPQKIPWGVTLMSGISPLAAWLRVMARSWRWWNIWMLHLRLRGIRAKCWLSRWKCRRPLFPGRGKGHEMMRAERRGWRTSPGASDIWRLCQSFDWLSSLENSCADVDAELRDKHLEESKIDIIFEAPVFWNWGGEEGNYELLIFVYHIHTHTHHNLADLADSDKTLIWAVPWHFVFDLVKKRPIGILGMAEGCGGQACL